MPLVENAGAAAKDGDEKESHQTDGDHNHDDNPEDANNFLLFHI